MPTLTNEEYFSSRSPQLDWLESTPAEREATVAALDHEEYVRRLEIEERAACGSWCEGCPICSEKWVI